MKLFICFAAFDIAFGKPLEFEISNKQQISVNENAEEIFTDFEFEKTLTDVEQMMKFPSNMEKIQEILIHEIFGNHSFNGKNRKCETRRHSQGWERIMF